MVDYGFQETTEFVSEEVIAMENSRSDLKSWDIQNHFYNLYKKNPERYGRLFFDENGDRPYSEDLESMIFDLWLSGKIKSTYNA